MRILGLGVLFCVNVWYNLLKMKKILFITRPGFDILEFMQVFLEMGFQCKVWNFEEVALLIEDGRMSAQNNVSGEDLTDFDQVLILSGRFDRQPMLSALACVAHKAGVQIMDGCFTNHSGKLYEMFCYTENDLPVPDTAFGSADFLQKCLNRWGGCGVLKATHAKKGESNFLVKSEADLARLLNENPNEDFILQRFIENDGDYRVLLVGGQVAMVIHRASDGDDHRNNTSVGGTATRLPLESMSEGDLDIAKKAAAAIGTDFAGVDLIKDKNTGKTSILEVNSNPQVASGSFIKEKAAAIAKLLG